MLFVSTSIHWENIRLFFWLNSENNSNSCHSIYSQIIEKETLKNLQFLFNTSSSYFLFRLWARLQSWRYKKTVFRQMMLSIFLFFSGTNLQNESLFYDFLKWLWLVDQQTSPWGDNGILIFFLNIYLQKSRRCKEWNTENVADRVALKCKYIWCCFFSRSTRISSIEVWPASTISNA